MRAFPSNDRMSEDFQNDNYILEKEDPLWTMKAA